MNTEKSLKSKVVEAAGGIVWRRTPEGPEVAVIHRPKYKDWTLPKGKREKDESWIETALREVYEETGFKGRPESFAGCNTYIFGSYIKVVLYWNMKIAENIGFNPNDEVDQLKWLSPEKAKSKLTYLNEKGLIPE